MPIQRVAQGVVPALFEAVSAAEVKQNGGHLNKEEEVFLYSIGIEVEGARKTLMSDQILTAGISRLSLRPNHSESPSGKSIRAPYVAGRQQLLAPEIVPPQTFRTGSERDGLPSINLM